MTNEELAGLVRAGGRDRLPELWGRVERFVAAQARRRLALTGGLGGVEFGDLYDAGYLALVWAADSYDPAGGRSFVGWLALYLRRAFSEAAGLRGTRRCRDPLHRAASLDAPLGEGEEPLGEGLADPEAELAFRRAEEALYHRQLSAALDRALDRLPPEQRLTLRRRYYDGRTLEEIAALYGVCPETVRQWQRRALRRLAQGRELRQYVEERTPYYLHCAARTGERTAEQVVLRREELAQRHREEQGQRHREG